MWCGSGIRRIGGRIRGGERTCLCVRTCIRACARLSTSTRVGARRSPRTRRGTRIGVDYTHGP